MSELEEHPSTTTMPTADDAAAVAEGIAAPATHGDGLDETALPVAPEPTGTTREREPCEDEEKKAKLAKKWMDSPSKAVISDCLMVWAEDKSLLSPEEILGLNKGAYVATHKMERLHVHTQDVIQLKSVSSCGGFENTNM